MNLKYMKYFWKFYWSKW